MIYTFMWLTIFGGAAIKTERLAAGQNLCCPGWNSTALEFKDSEVREKRFVKYCIGGISFNILSFFNCCSVTHCNGLKLVSDIKS